MNFTRSSESSCCLICCQCERMSELPDNDELAKTFFKHLESYLFNEWENDLENELENEVKTNLSKFANARNSLCTKCVKLIESFCDLYKILRETELKLGEKLLELKSGLIMKCSKLRNDLDEKKHFRWALGMTCEVHARKLLHIETPEDSSGDLFEDNPATVDSKSVRKSSRVKRKPSPPPVQDVPKAKRAKKETKKEVKSDKNRQHNAPEQNLQRNVKIKSSPSPPVEDVPNAKRMKKKKEVNSYKNLQNNAADKFICKTRFPCDIKTCKEIMFSFQDLQKHKKFHGTFPCTCGKTFQYAPDLCLHEKVHGGKRKLEIGVCPKTACKYKPKPGHSDTKKKAEYIRHFLKTHLKLKLEVPRHTISCGICSVGFTQKVHFNVHFDICHNLDKLKEGEEAWICDWDSDECTAYFLTSDQLAKHKYLMHSGKFECDECADRFITLIELRRHLIRVHGKNELTISNEEEADESVPEVEEVAEWILPDFAEVERIDVGEVKEEKPCVDETLFIEDDDLLPASIKKESGMQ